MCVCVCVCVCMCACMRIAMHQHEVDCHKNINKLPRQYSLVACPLANPLRLIECDFVLLSYM